MKWSVKLGRFAGVDVFLHVTFVLLVLLVAASGLLDGGTLADAMEGVVLVLAVFGCVLLHEYGHALAARGFGIRTRDITLLPIGGVARLERMPERPAQELWVALAGPAVNGIIAAALAAWLLLKGAMTGLGWTEWFEGSLAQHLLLVNLSLIGFNLIPAFPMDGGRVLRAVLAMGMGQERATHIAAKVGRGLALVFAFYGLRGFFGGAGNPMLLFIAGFVWMSAGQEVGNSRRQARQGRVGTADSLEARPGVPPVLR